MYVGRRQGLMNLHKWMVEQMKRILSSERGITLMEIMIGVVIIGIVASMAVPRFGIAMDRMQFRSTNRDVVSTLRLARSHAISEKNEYGVYFNAGDLTATFFEKIGSNLAAYEDGTDRVVKVDTLGGVPGACLDGLGATFVNSAVIFDPDGSANTGGILWTVELTEDIVGVAKISVLPATGRISSETTIY